MIRSDGLCASGRLFLFLEGKTPPQQKIEGKGHTMTHMLRNRQYVHNLLSQCFVSYGSTNYTALWATGYLGDLSAVLVVDELRRQAVDRRCCKRPSRLRNWSVCTHPTFTRRTASELTTVHRPNPLLPSSGFFFQESPILHILDTQRVCSVSLTTDSVNLCSLLQEYHRIFLSFYGEAPLYGVW